MWGLLVWEYVIKRVWSMGESVWSQRMRGPCDFGAWSQRMMWGLEVSENCCGVQVVSEHGIRVVSENDVGS